VSDKTLRKIRVFQPDAYISVNCFKRELSVAQLDDEVKDLSGFPQVITRKMKFPGSDPLADQIRSFVNVVLDGAEPVVSGQDGRKVLNIALTIMDQIQRECRTFEPVR
jgi:predicted dehydrogenase